MLELVNVKKKKSIYIPRKREGRPRFIVASIYNKKKQLVKTIRYTEIDTALPRLTYHAMRLEPGYTIQITHFLTGLWIGDIVVKVNGVLKSQFTWDDKGSHRH